MIRRVLATLQDDPSPISRVDRRPNAPLSKHSQMIDNTQEFAGSTAHEQPFGQPVLARADEESDALSVQEHFERPSNRHRWTYQAAGRANTLSSACPLPPKSPKQEARLPSKILVNSFCLFGRNHGRNTSFHFSVLGFIGWDSACVRELCESCHC